MEGVNKGETCQTDMEENEWVASLKLLEMQDPSPLGLLWMV